MENVASSRENRLRQLFSAPVVLTDGGIETRLIYEFHFVLPEFASFLALFDPAQRMALETIYRSYIAIATEFHRPMQLGRRPGERTRNVWNALDSGNRTIANE